MALGARLHQIALAAMLGFAFIQFALANENDEQDVSSRQSTCHLSNGTIYGFDVETLDGKKMKLDEYSGKVLLIVNVATFCGYTYQYNDFNPMLERNRNGTLRILAFPCNQFHLQEPAKNEEILNGLKHVRPGGGWDPHKNLHIFGKLEVNGEDNHPLYAHLKEHCSQTVPVIGKRDTLMYDPIRVNDVTWNFEKFLVDKRGHVRHRFHPTAWMTGELVQPLIDQLERE